VCFPRLRVNLVRVGIVLALCECILAFCKKNDFFDRMIVFSASFSAMYFEWVPVAHGSIGHEPFTALGQWEIPRHGSL